MPVVESLCEASRFFCTSQVCRRRASWIPSRVIVETALSLPPTATARWCMNVSDDVLVEEVVTPLVFFFSEPAGTSLPRLLRPLSLYLCLAAGRNAIALDMGVARSNVMMCGVRNCLLVFVRKDLLDEFSFPSTTPRTALTSMYYAIYSLPRKGLVEFFEQWLLRET
jgi:hypothetical protein